MKYKELKEKAKKILLSLRKVRKENKSKISAVEMKEILREDKTPLNIGKRIKVQFEKN